MKAGHPITAKWLLASYALAVLAIFLLGADGVDVLIFGVLLGVPWIVAPAGLAALLAAPSDDPLVSWGSPAIGTAAIGSTAWARLTLAMQPDPRNGIVMMLLPMLQFFAVPLCLFPLLVWHRLFGREQRSAS